MMPSDLRMASGWLQDDSRMTSEWPQNDFTGWLHRMTSQDDFTGWLHRMILQDDFTGWLHRMTSQDDFTGWLQNDFTGWLQYELSWKHFEVNVLCLGFCLWTWAWYMVGKTLKTQKSSFHTNTKTSFTFSSALIHVTRSMNLCINKNTIIKSIRMWFRFRSVILN